ncbi:BadF/BadG/BcrA/BcrD ATPase family protein [Daeguia caeni]|uniref:BadF/BadG/BcrA/BcrD ATPase family protein n=1 Tax=Daeguia caeni TaxID=439612 RepID=A0ABV9H8U6_9HYPH
MQLYMGIDGGGSGCRAILADSSGTILGMGTAGPANIGAHPHDACAHIKCAALQTLTNAGLEAELLSTLKVTLGLAGAKSVLNLQEIADVLPFKESRIVSDAITAFQGALGHGDGAIIITGTGSAFVKRIDSDYEIIGGRGFMLSDHAGGARLGRELLEETLLAMDGLAPFTSLAQQVAHHFDHDIRQIITFSRSAQAADYARFAPLIFRHESEGDALAQKILKRACEHLCQGLQRMGIESLGRFSMTGGLAASYLGLPYFPCRDHYVTPAGDSLQGALELALAM